MDLYLRDRATRVEVSAEAQIDLSIRQIAEIQHRWTLFKETRPPAGNSATEEDRSWGWRSKALQITDGVSQIVALYARGDVQGLMLINTKPTSSRLALGHLLYVEYIESAPWNQPKYTDHPALSNVGVALLTAARELSRRAGCLGALGLHSLAAAVPFYLKSGFRSFGYDATEGYVYLELPAVYA